MTLSFGSLKTYQELAGWADDRAFTNCVKACLETQKALTADRLASHFVPDAAAADACVSEPALAALMEAGREPHGISTERHISNVVVFNAASIPDAIQLDRIKAMRRDIDAIVARKIDASFDTSLGVDIVESGHFWYPPGAYMGWHTNSAAPGWRMYVTHTEEPKRSFFRYRDPDSGEIVTSWDAAWNVRIFEVRQGRPFWHAVWSDTNRFSLGYVIKPGTVRTKIKSLFAR